VKEPPGVAILAARLQRAYPALNPYQCANLAVDLCAIERAQHRHAERQCSGADGGYVRRKDFAKLAVFDGKEPRGTTEWHRDPGSGRWIVEHDPEAEERAEERIAKRVAQWRTQLGEIAGPISRDWSDFNIERQGDPRGAVLLLQLPGESEAKAV
jgi:hypothetical protein